MARRTAADGAKPGRGRRHGGVSAASAANEDVDSTRPNAPGLRYLARAHAAAAVDALAAVMRDPTATPAARVSAAGALLAWGYGKAAPGEAERRRVSPSEQVIRLVWGGDDA